MIRITCFPEDLILPIVYAIDARDLNHVRRTVPLARLMPTQPDLFPSILDFYRQRTRMTDEDNALPYGICFAGSDTVYITNGHHRWYVCRERGRKSLRMWVHTYPLSLLEALRHVLAPPEPLPVPPKRARTRPINPRQLPLSFPAFYA